MAAQQADLDLAAISLVRLGTPATVARLMRCGARVLGRGALVPVSAGAAPDRQGSGDAGWVLMRTPLSGRRVLIVLAADEDEKRGPRC